MAEPVLRASQQPTATGSLAEAANMITFEQAGKDVEAFFGVKALQKQKAMNTGRHPSSLPKNSELWHYSKLSTQRRNRIKKGHQFWNVIDQENVESTVPAPLEQDQKDKDDDEYAKKARELRFLKGSSVNQQLRSFLATAKSNDMQHLELRVDFKNQNQIYFGMSFIIMNYADEILYVNSKEELRCKPINQIEPTDRIKFKMVDLNNPSNPHPLCFGDTMYLQCLEASETADNSFSVGTVLTSKLFGLPQHACLNFDVNQTYTTTDSYSQNTTSAAAKGHNALFADDDAEQAAPDSPGEATPAAAPQLMRRVSTMNIVKAPTTPGGNGAQSGLDGFPATAAEVDGEDASSVGDLSKAAAEGLAAAAALETPAAARSKQYSNQANICGDVHITRICEARMLENSLGFLLSDFGLLSDDKALRYTSKAASLLGKWCVHSAELESSPTKEKQKNHHAYGAAKATQSMHASKDTHQGSGTSGGDLLRAVKDNRVYSMTPIFIQQDLYCISTKQPTEHNTWPMRSTAIINKSTNISKDTAMEYRTAYRESAVVKNALQQRQHQKGTTRLFDLDDSLDDTSTTGHHHNRGHHQHHDNGGGGDNSSIASGANASLAGGSGNGNNNNGTSGAASQSSYGCLRKVVKRGPPYDFSVDRRCVWKFCLFEQFSDNNIKLSVKDRAAKKVMETATMAMKLSQLNREGAHTHIQNHTYGEDLPPLKSGESFVRTLREINFKTTIKLEEKYLEMRRAKEARLREHFAGHMTDLRAMEKLDEEERAVKSKTKSPRNLASSSLASSNSSFFSESADTPTGRNRVKPTNSTFVTAASMSPEGGSQRAMSPKMRTLMTKTQGRQTAFLIDSLPPHLKPGGKDYNPNASTTSLLSSSMASSSNLLNSPTALSGLTPSAKIIAITNRDQFGPNVRFQDDYSTTSYGTTTAAAMARSSSSIAGGAQSAKSTHSEASSVVSSGAPAPNLSGLVTNTTSRNVLGTTAARGRNSVTFTLDKNASSGTNGAGGGGGGGGGGVLDQTMTNPDNLGVSHAAQLAIQAVAALPDFDARTRDREAKLHLHPRRLLLDNPKSLHLYDELSAGEQVLALHKTFHHIAEVAADPNRPRRHTLSTTTSRAAANSVAAKLSRLLEEDKNIKQVLHHKERQELLRNKEELYEHSSGI